MCAERLLKPLRHGQQAAIAALRRDQLQPDRCARIAYRAGHADARHAEQRPQAVEGRRASARVADGRLVGCAGCQQRVEALQPSLRLGAGLQRERLRGLVGDRGDVARALQVVSQHRRQRISMVVELPSQAAPRLETLHLRVGLEGRVGPGRQGAAAHLDARRL